MPARADVVEQTVVTAIATVCRRAPGTVTRTTRLLDLSMDSLTLVAVLTQVEAALDTTFDADDIAELLTSRYVSELAAAVARKL
jgi:acyl carrier protein